MTFQIIFLNLPENFIEFSFNGKNKKKTFSNLNEALKEAKYHFEIKEYELKIYDIYKVNSCY